jgi:hypothetical protein
LARKISYGKTCYQTYQNTQNSLKSGLAFDANFEHPTLQGVTNERALTQGVASLALGILAAQLRFAASICKLSAMCCCPFRACIIGCTSAIQTSLIAFGLHDNSGRASAIVCNT